ncbi:retrovirus-related pol polyprotein from transposon TNT 1-94 [Tanacetum coccineum]
MIVFHNEDGNPARANIKQALGYFKDGDGDGNSLPHKGVKASANSDVMYSFTSAQDGNPLQDDVRLCLGDVLKKAQDHCQRQADEVVSDIDSSTLGPERDRVVADLSQPENDRLRSDIRATNILLQGFPRDIYKLINHNTYAKDIWDNVKMLLEGSELTKDDRESQLYDEFEHFRQHKGENIHDYYVRFTKLINDMRHIKMTMPKIQLNSKFVNNMLPEWGRFMMAVKLNKGLKESNHDQLYAYLKQHKGRQNRVQGNNARGVVVAGNGVAQNRAGNANTGQGKPIKCYNCNGMGHIARNCIQPKRSHRNTCLLQESCCLMPSLRKNGVDLDVGAVCCLLRRGQDKILLMMWWARGPGSGMAQNETISFLS